MIQFLKIGNVVHFLLLLALVIKNRVVSAPTAGEIGNSGSDIENVNDGGERRSFVKELLKYTGYHEELLSSKIEDYLSLNGAFELFTIAENIRSAINAQDKKLRDRDNLQAMNKSIINNGYAIGNLTINNGYAIGNLTINNGYAIRNLTVSVADLSRRVSTLEISEGTLPLATTAPPLIRATASLTANATRRYVGDFSGCSYTCQDFNGSWNSDAKRISECCFSKYGYLNGECMKTYPPTPSCYTRNGNIDTSANFPECDLLCTHRSFNEQRQNLLDTCCKKKGWDSGSCTESNRCRCVHVDGEDSSHLFM